MNPVQTVALGQAQTSRRHELDWLKVIVTLLVLVFHTARVFDNEDWNVKNDPLLERQGAILALFERGKTTTAPLATPRQIADLTGARHFDADQRAFLEQIALNRDRFVRFPAEIQTGFVYRDKATAAFAALRELAGDRPLVALAPNPGLARLLQTETRIPSAAFDGWMGPRRGEIVLVDYAAIPSGSALEQFLMRVERAGGRALLVGQPQAPAADVLVAFLNQWFMPLFFVLSGVGTWFALGFRSAGRYVAERCNRLLVPFVFGCLVLTPPQVYCEALRDPAYRASFAQFYPSFFTFLGPDARFSWGHLWFVLYLFIFSLVALPIFLWLRSEPGRRWIAALAGWCEKPGVILLAGLPLALSEAILRIRWPVRNNLYDDWANIAYYLLFFLYGYLLCADPRFGQAIDRHWRLALAGAVVLMAILFTWSFTNSAPLEGYTPLLVGVMFVRGLRAWLWVVAILGFARRYLAFTNPLLRYSGEAAYPFYLLHQTAIIVIGFWVVRWSTGASEKFLIIGFGSLAGCLLIYELLIRRISVTRYLFGLRPKPASPVTAVHSG
ncbi:acyltransferase family protein [Gloeobacter violaceus]|uniref:Gll2718 protein n=1 Tax=Gloeobacter violaceus (strain ATCC 29082 / PCC 7421) TaxID=251221 RepID=Q7NH19_GLOVI|nr:acyltransferase family protein [Gloeobacter violaceus]BAC90659.1 gll2718 [Gloeobacter violaceus PCC 7421]